jgi:hypothetical protein
MDVIFRVESLIEEVRREHARDPRTSIFEVEVIEDAGGLALMGATSEPAAAEELHRRVGVLGDAVRIRDEVERLPNGDLEEKPFALVRAAVAPLVAGPEVSAAIVSQAVLGQRLAPLRIFGRWLQCRSEDGYIGWVHRGYLCPVSEVEATEWEVGSGGELAVSLGATLLDLDGGVIARLPWGARVVVEEARTARLPDGRRGTIDGEVVPLSELPADFPAEGAAVVATAGRWVAAPYLWGGITPAGVDCSGLAQAVYRMHGILLPRDSDLQTRIGEPVDPHPDFHALLPGDLLFFAEEPRRVSHVALSLGGSQIIHASLGNGGVARNDLLGGSSYEEELRGLLVGVRRVL